MSLAGKEEKKKINENQEKYFKKEKNENLRKFHLSLPEKKLSKSAV